jgi:hypothetical protein
MADVFDNAVPETWRQNLWALIAATPALDWLLLTKRPQNILKMLPASWGDDWQNDWIIAGGESGRGRRAMLPGWARSLRNQCAAAGSRFSSSNGAPRPPGTTCWTGCCTTHGRHPRRTISLIARGGDKGLVFRLWRAPTQIKLAGMASDVCDRYC